MTIDQRVEMLEQELAKLRGKPVVYASNAYAVASQNCKAYFESVRLDGQHWGAETCCASAARCAFKEKHGVYKGRDVPAHYIRTEADAAEYTELYKLFLGVYQNYLKEREGFHGKE